MQQPWPQRCSWEKEESNFPFLQCHLSASWSNNALALWAAQTSLGAACVIVAHPCFRFATILCFPLSSFFFHNQAIAAWWASSSTRKTDDQQQCVAAHTERDSTHVCQLHSLLQWLFSGATGGSNLTPWIFLLMAHQSKWVEVCIFQHQPCAPMLSHSL